MDTSYALAPDSLVKFDQLRHDAIETVSSRACAAYASQYERLGERWRKTCREDFGFHLDFLRPVLAFGSLEPFTEYLRWLEEVLSTRNIPARHVAESLFWLGEFFSARMGADGVSIAKALENAVAQSHEDPPPPSELATLDKWGNQDELELALLKGNRSYALSIVTELLKAGHSLAEIEVHLIQRALYNIGIRWQKNEVSIVQEHLATATAQTVMANAFAQLSLPILNGNKIILACVEGNEHSVGLRMVSDAFETNGWEVQFLGANTPTRSLVDQVRAWRPDMVGLSISFPHHLTAARDAVNLIRLENTEKCPFIIAGGYAINRFPPLVRCLGADAYANDALAALQHAHR